jgi:hypothetical protein
MPMSITRTSPTCRAPGATYRPIFGAWFVVVTLARIADHDADGSPSGDPGRGRRQPRSGLLGEFQFQDAAPLHRKAIRRPHLVRVV